MEADISLVGVPASAQHSVIALRSGGPTAVTRIVTPESTIARDFPSVNSLRCWNCCSC
jgi:hypothetical protein